MVRTMGAKQKAGKVKKTVPPIGSVRSITWHTIRTAPHQRQSGEVTERSPSPDIRRNMAVFLEVVVEEASSAWRDERIDFTPCSSSSSFLCPPGTSEPSRMFASLRRREKEKNARHDGDGDGGTGEVLVLPDVAPSFSGVGRGEKNDSTPLAIVTGEIRGGG